MFYKFFTITLMIVTLGVVVLVGYNIYSTIFSKNEPPEIRSYVPIPIQIGDKTMLIGVGIVNWEVPPELKSTYLQIEQMNREDVDAEEIKAEEQKDGIEKDANENNSKEE